MQEWKFSEKEAQKMTHDGAISVNLVTGEATHISDRPPEQDYSSADETAGVLNRAADEAEQEGRSRLARAVQEGEAVKEAARREAEDQACRLRSQAEERMTNAVEQAAGLLLS